MERIYQRKKAASKELRDLLKATGSTLISLHGIGPSGAARLLAEVSDITRFSSKAHFASWNGTAPTGASSGDQVRHRLSRTGNRQVNRALHIMAVVQLRNAHRRPRLLRPLIVAARRRITQHPCRKGSHRLDTKTAPPSRWPASLPPPRVDGADSHHSTGRGGHDPG